MENNPIFYNRLNGILQKRRELFYKLSEKDIIFVSAEEVAEINRVIMAGYKGIHGVNRDLLESAVASAINKYEYKNEKDKIRLGAILMERIIKNHPFVDGNKRTAIAAMEMFFDANLVKAEMSNDFLYKTAYIVAQNKVTTDELCDRFCSVLLSHAKEKSEGKAGIAELKTARSR
ncbi:MAG: hypothetical protein DDT19_01799 [Syntrophomonadaceae bacterium]|nr:hypothetical protein [Bacillota bacterium]